MLKHLVKKVEGNFSNSKDKFDPLTTNFDVFKKLSLQ